MSQRLWGGTSNRHDAVLDGEVNQLGAGVQVQRLHHLVFVELDRAGRDSPAWRRSLSPRGLRPATGEFPAAAA